MSEQEIELMFSCILTSVFKIKGIKEGINESEISVFVAKKIGEDVFFDKKKLLTFFKKMGC